jgi:hypothetical protein
MTPKLRQQTRNMHAPQVTMSPPGSIRPRRHQPTAFGVIPGEAGQIRGEVFSAECGRVTAELKNSPLSSRATENLSGSGSIVTKF